MHADLKPALAALWKVRRSDEQVIALNRGGSLRANSVVNFFVAMFDELVIDGCSSHSGRSTFINTAARNVHRAGDSLRDVQMLDGHASIETTQRYIDRDTHSQSAASSGCSEHNSPRRRPPRGAHSPTFRQIDMTEDSERSSRICELNDAFRTTLTGGIVLFRAGIIAKGAAFQAALLDAVRNYDDFDEDCDPWQDTTLAR